MAAERFSHSRSLFTTDRGPMRFYVRPGPLKRQLSQLITHGGGVMCRVQEPGAFLLAEPGQAQGIQYMSIAYVTDCVRSNRRLSSRTYRLLNRTAAGPGQNLIGAGDPDSSPRGKTRQGQKTGAGGESEDPGSRDKSPNTSGPREEVHSALDSNPERRRTRHSYNATITGATASRGPSISIGSSACIECSPPSDAPALCEPSPSASGPALGDPSPSASGPALCDPSPSASGPALCDPSTFSEAPVSCDPITFSPVSCDPSTSAGAPELCDYGPSAVVPTLCNSSPSAGSLTSCNSRPSKKAPTLCEPSPSVGASASFDPRPSVGVSVMDDHIAEAGGDEAQKPGEESSVKPISNETEPGHPGGNHIVEEDQTKCGEASEHQVVPGQSCRKATGLMRRLPFSRQEDITILRYVQENKAPNRSVTGTLLWKELEKKKILRRTWETMRSRYTRFIVHHKHWYELPPKGSLQAAGKMDPIETPRNSGDPSSATVDFIAQQHELPPAETSVKNLHPHEDFLNVAISGIQPDTRHGACTDLTPSDDHKSKNRHGGSTLIRRLRSANKRIVTKETQKPGQETGVSLSEWEDNRSSMATSKQLLNSQENQDTDNSEDLQIFEIANMEFEVDDEDSSCKVKVPVISLKDFVMGEDSVNTDTQMQIDYVTSSLDLSDSEGLQDVLTNLMNEFKLDICQVTQALLKNNGEVGSTRHFLRTGLRPDGFPIWEHEDDVNLQRNEPAVRVQLAKKYGADNVAKRVAFLAS